MKRFKYIFGLLVVIALGLAIIIAWQPRSVAVDLVAIDSGSIEVTVNEDGKTRIKEKYVISAPVGGRLRRVLLREGDSVICSETLIASIQPGDPVLLDARTLSEARARVAAAETSVERAATRLEQANIELERTEKEFERMKLLRRTNAVSEKNFELAQADYNSSLQTKRACEFDQEIAIYESQMAKAALLHVQSDSGTESSDVPLEHFEILSPIDGVILKVFLESSTIVTPGTPIVEVGDPKDLEVVADVLSTDAVKIQPGATVYLEQWGQHQVLPGVVRLVEPSAFEKISALGVEEQRVNVIIDFKDDSNRQTSLGDGYRIEARIVIARVDQVLRVPVGALFREQDEWAVFRWSNGRAELVPVTLGQRNDQFAEVISGLSLGDSVVLHPSDKISHDAPIVRR
ncbi:MAG TPA: HlyD family efflux transporter periplasmic adaptor subunit [Pirellulaceae bacterium]|mgnify:CR=1 FL=1|nr:HlyD family efflux transporter periplasmic adaptor subunit [Pirellulaceae bacterium]HMO93595.1 HlyD family efflux transporter periplasmic adaptor subunit [Pirellulaceae bacterium]HMP70519.1 HlyD family efflux transporter periplasmic adaptor subunit [Pirellulaceae bacterium]